MAIRIDERFVVKAPAGAVWGYLVDPRRVVRCVPGGELDEVVDERNFRGKIRVRIGAVTLRYGGRVRLAEVDAAARRVRIVGEAREPRGTDSGRLWLDSWLASLPDGSTEVVARIHADVFGPAVELLRGMIEQLTREVFRDFAACVRATIEAEQGGPVAAAPRRDALHPIPLLLRALRSWIAGLVRPQRFW